MAGPNADLSNAIVIDNLPVVDSLKYDKLFNLINKIVNSFNCPAVRVELCKDEKGGTVGFAFVEYNSPVEAERAVMKMNNQKLDKSHIFKVCLFSDWEKFRNTPEEYTEPTEVEYKEEENLQAWVLDPNAREQYMVRHADNTEIWWNDPIQMAKQVTEYSKENWTDIIARWSPLGTYLATFHQQGVQLWGGSDWRTLGRFPHNHVQLIDFSPKESFLVTWFNKLTVWDTKTQKRLRDFPGGPTPEHGWPVFKWSASENFLAKITEDNIHIFDSKTMKLVQPDPKKTTTLYVPHVRSFEWSPTDNILSYWVPEVGDKPARVVLVKVVQRGEKVEFEQLTQKNLFRVLDIKMHWSGNGDFLCVKVDRFSKSSKTKEKVTNFELFRMRTRELAVEVVELTEEVIAFAWEPRGTRFAFIHGDNPSRYTVAFYTMSNPRTGTCKLIKSLPKKQANHLFWSPKGNHIVLAGLKSFNGILEFWNVNEMELMGGGEHFMCTDVEWDPSGRYMSTSVSFYRHQMENGYILWTFQGKQFLSLSREKFFQFQWRPRPACTLTDSRLKQISKDLKNRAAKYEEEEKMMERREIETLLRQKKEKWDAFHKFLADRREMMQPLQEKRRASRRNCDYHSDDESCYKVTEQLHEEVVSIQEMPYPEK